MSTIINLDNLDADTLEGLRREAARRGVDMSVLACELLRERFRQVLQTRPVDSDPDDARKLRELAGTWSEKDDAEFLAATADFEKIDEELWR